MHAAVVRSFDRPPRYEQFEPPRPESSEEVVGEVLAVGLHPRVRTGAAGRHYTSSRVLPMIPGVDGVARRPDGGLAYFVASDDVIGTMADRAIIDSHRAIALRSDADVVRLAAAMNPAMSGWVALRRRVPLAAGQSVLVLGATGNAGAMAVQIAKHLGAGRVVAAGRNRARLDALTGCGADDLIALTDDPHDVADAVGRSAAEVDIVLDYLWGRPTEQALTAVLTRRADRSRRLDWIQIGAVAGPTIALPSVALRSADLRLLGNGQGAVSARSYLAELPSLVNAIENGSLAVATTTARLCDVEQVWSESDDPGVRTVLIP
jgi:NADPH:quinone reductase-like Zn-dependent oxidoreductase